MSTLIIFSAIKTLLICVLGTVFLAFGAHKGFPYFNFKGRMNRVQFGLSFIGALLVLYFFNDFIHMAYEAVVILPAYWGVQLGAFLVHILIYPFILVPLIGRLRDFDIFSIPAFILTALIIYSFNYNFLPATDVIVDGLLFILIAVLVIIPGTSLPNKYGRPSLWPYKTEKNPFKRKAPNHKKKQP